VAGVMLVVASELSGQNSRINSNTGQAVLHMTVMVVPTVFSPPLLPHKSANRGSVSYEIVFSEPPLEVSTQESRIRLNGVDTGLGGNTASNATLLTTTISPR